MMNSKRLFVTKEDNFTLSVYFTKENNLKVAKEVPAGDDALWERFDVEFALPDYGISKGIMRASTELSGGNQIFNYAQFNNALLCSMAKKWNLTNEKGEEIPLDLQKLNELRPDITGLFVELLQDKLRKEGLYDAIVLS